MREQLLAAEKVTAIAWRDGALHLLDQRLLPHEETWHRYDSAAAVADAIRQMVVRGAPAIGISAAYGVVLGARARLAEGGDWRATLAADVRVLAESRPTAVNLFWALDRMKACLARIAPDTANDEALHHLEAEAIAVHNQDREANLTMAELGLALIRQHADHPQKLLTHCNTGALATGGFGTALGVIRAAHAAGLVDCVFADETRPWLQGARLTAWELAGEQIPVRLNADAAAAHLMKTEGITWVIVGADRITANGDVANKIGTYQLAVTARYHGVRFMVVAPSSTIDMSLDNGNAIPIEERTGRELLEISGQRVAAAVEAVNPVFDVTPAELIDAIVTERGVVQHPTRAQMQSLMRD